MAATPNTSMPKVRGLRSGAGACMVAALGLGGPYCLHTATAAARSSYGMM